MTALLRVLALAAVLTACAQPATTAPAAVPVAPTVPPSPTPVATAHAPTSEPEPTIAPSRPRITVGVQSAPYEVVTGFALKEGTVDQAVKDDVTQAVERYLLDLNAFRNHPDQASLPISGAFGDVVRVGIQRTASDGIKREFELGSMTIQRYMVKPWGVPVYADVRAKILDRAVNGDAPLQSETGVLRLRAGPLRVIDGWDTANGRWFNDERWPALPEDSIRSSTGHAIENYLRPETWSPGVPLETFIGPGDDPFAEIRAGYLKTFDRTKIVARVFETVTARIQKYETFAEIPHGIATVTFTGTVVATDDKGVTSRHAFARTVLILFGSWMPEVIDEETSPGVWMSDGKLMAILNARDRSFG